MACSALKRSYRDKLLREGAGGHVDKLLFVRFPNAPNDLPACAHFAWQSRKGWSWTCYSCFGSCYRAQTDFEIAFQPCDVALVQPGSCIACERAQVGDVAARKEVVRLGLGSGAATGDHLRKCTIQVLLLPPREELQRRVEARWAEGSHFMPPSLLDSQLSALMVSYGPQALPLTSNRWCSLAWVRGRESPETSCQSMTATCCPRPFAYNNATSVENDVCWKGKQTAPGPRARSSCTVAP